MNKTKSRISITGIDISIGVTVVLCLVVCHVADLLGVRIQTLSACTGAVMCVQDNRIASWGAGLNRILGVICGGMAGIAVVLADNLIQIKPVFYLLMGVGVVLNLLLCKLVKLPFVQARVSCMSLMLVTLVLQDGARIHYAFGRLVGTLVGAVMALLVSAAFAVIIQEKKVLTDRSLNYEAIF